MLDRGRGIAAQRALLYGGTLANGMVRLVKRRSHGRDIRELVAGVVFEAGDDVTCYGGMVSKQPSIMTAQSKLQQTHVRNIPSSDYVLDGLEFSKCVPDEPYPVENDKLLFPDCNDKRWTNVLLNTGVGYMANTVTKCPLNPRERPNVVIYEAVLHRSIQGVPYDSVILLRAASRGIAKEEKIISPYEGYKNDPDFHHDCVDDEHHDEVNDAMDI